jgi:methionyl aminopeptidase
MTNTRPLSPKSPEEIERLARGGAILRGVLEEVAALVKPGVTGAYLDAEAERRLRRRRAEPSFKGYSTSGRPNDAFPAALCVSVNSAVVHGLPTDVPFQEGDIVGLDLGCRFEELYTDTAMTVPVGKISREAKRLLTITRRALTAAVALVRPGVTTGDIGATVQKIVEKAGFSVVRDLVGHGVGYDVHEEPNIPNFGKPGGGVALLEGAVIAIEPMVVVGQHQVEVAPDGWTVVVKDRTLAAHEELTVAVTSDGVRVLTKAA